MKPKEIERTNLATRGSPSKLINCALEFLFYFISVMKKEAWGKYTRLMHMFPAFRSELHSQNPSTRAKLKLSLENLLFYFQDQVTNILHPSNWWTFQARSHQNYHLKPKMKIKRKSFWKQMRSHSCSVHGGLILRNSLSGFLRYSLELQLHCALSALGVWRGNKKIWRKKEISMICPLVYIFFVPIYLNILKAERENLLYLSILTQVIIGCY